MSACLGASSNAEAKPRRRVAWIPSPRPMLHEEGAREDESDGFIQYPRMIDGVEVAIFFHETGEREGARRFSLQGARRRQRTGPRVWRRRARPGGRLHARRPLDDVEQRVDARAVEAAGGTGDVPISVRFRRPSSTCSSRRAPPRTTPWLASGGSWACARSATAAPWIQARRGSCRS